MSNLLFFNQRDFSSHGVCSVITDFGLNSDGHFAIKGGNFYA